MFIDISGRTDIVNYYSEWMFKRFEAGYVYSRNSLFPNSVRRYELTPGKVGNLCLYCGAFVRAVPPLHFQLCGDV